MKWFYFSFATDQDGFLGGVYAQGADNLSAFFALTLKGLNPGGEVVVVGPLPVVDFEEHVPEGERWRLLSREEVEAR